MIGIIIVIVLAIAVYFLATSGDQFGIKNEVGADETPALPGSELSGEVLKVFENANTGLEPPAIPIGWLNEIENFTFGNYFIGKF